MTRTFNVPSAAQHHRAVLMAKIDVTRVDHMRQAEDLALFAQFVTIDAHRSKSLGRDTVPHGGEKAAKSVEPGAMTMTAAMAAWKSTI